MARYVGGPCDGQLAPSDTYAQRECGNVRYTIGEDGNYHAPGGLPGFAPGYSHARHQVDTAFRRLMRAYGITMARALHRSASGRRRMKRVVR